MEDAVEHYKFLAREVTVLGSNKDEYFEVVRLPTGDVSVKMFKAGKDDDHGKKLYERVFKKGETKAIDIYGFGGNDKIKVEGDASKSILVRVIGGEGKDLVEDNSRVNGLGHCTVFYDLKDSTSRIVSKGEVASRMSKNPAVNSYDRRAFKYDRLAPIVFGNYNVDDGFFIGGGFYYQKEGFRKAPI